MFAGNCDFRYSGAENGGVVRFYAKRSLVARTIWTFLAIILSLVIGYWAFGGAGSTISTFADGLALSIPATVLAESPFPAAVLAVCAGALVMFGLVFLAPAIFDGVTVRLSTNNLKDIPVADTGQDRVTLTTFLTAFERNGALTDIARAYAATLHDESLGWHSGGPRTTGLRTTVPAHAYFSKEAVVNGPLMMRFFRTLPRVLGGVGAIGGLLALYQGIDRYRGALTQAATDATALEPLATAGQVGIVALLIGFATAVLISVVQNAVLATRYRQTERLWQIIDGRFRGGAEPDYLRDLAMAAHAQNAELCQVVQSGLENLGTEYGNQNTRLIDAVGHQSAETARALAKGIRAALAEPMAELAKSAKALAGDQGEAVQGILDATLPNITTRLSAHVVEQQEQIDRALRRTETLVGNVEETLNSLTARLADSFQAGLEGSAVQDLEQRREMVAAIELCVDTLVSHVDGHAKAFEGALGSMQERLQTLADGSLATTGENLRQAATSFTDLKDAIAELAASATPALDKVVETQETILGLLDETQDGGKLIGAAAQDLNDAAQVSRAVVEQVVDLAANMNGAMAALADLSKPASENGGGEPHLPLHHTAKPRVSSALKELREAAEDMSRQLPKL